MPTTTDLYLVRKLLRTFVPTFLGLCFLFFIAATFRILREPELSLAQVVLVLPWLLPFLLPYLLPLAYMTTVALVYGRMVADNEVLAFASLGIPARTLAGPAVLLAALLSLGVAWLTAEVVPHSHKMKAEAQRAVFEGLLSLGEGEHLSQAFHREGFDLYVRRYRPGRLEGVVIHYDLPLGGSPIPAQIVAESGRITKPETGGDDKRIALHLENVRATLIPPARAGDSTDAADAGDPPGGLRTGPVRLHLERYELESRARGLRRVKADDYTSADLRRLMDGMRRRDALGAAAGGVVAVFQGLDERPVEFQAELAMRQGLATAPLLITLLVLPLTLLLRARSPLVPFVVGLAATALLFFAPLILGKSLAEAMAQPLLVFLGCGTCLAGAAVAAWWSGRR